ncbi:hypothetical protein PSTT_07957 [Puccinia striiformis]|uniref:Uncharacterized protein n=1 Tax=Puccinia striiformis TaxID=27350 RepID=A0A2S4VED2_9BASI|nr:hypothetical protein PSTT_07957 [Puccinia striiformis]
MNIVNFLLHNVSEHVALVGELSRL